jgi:hypothetical protein
MAAAIGVPHTARGHEVITTKLTWSKEVSRIVFARCAQCHRPGGAAFALLNYEEARPWAKAIQEQVLTRQMPPWNAVKGFGDFAPDYGLSQEEIATMSSWVEGGAPEGDPNHLPPMPALQKPLRKLSGASIVIARAFTLTKPSRILAIEVAGIAPGASAKLIAIRPDGEQIPMIWIRDYSPKATQQYRLSEALLLPPGTSIEVQGEARFRLRVSI